MYGNLIVFCIIIFSTERQSPDPPEYSEEDPYPYEDLITFDENRRRRPWSLTPPPACVDPSAGHEICVPPVWGERVPGSPLLEECFVCRESRRHLAIRCVQCHQTSACCSCLWTYMRARYNRGCPLCRFGDPGEGNNPLLAPAGTTTTRNVVARSGTGRGIVTGIHRRGPPAILPVRGRVQRGRGRRGSGRGISTWTRGRGSPGMAEVLGFNPETGGFVIGRRGTPRRPLIEIDNAESGDRVEVHMEIEVEIEEEEIIEPASPEYEDHPGQ